MTPRPPSRFCRAMILLGAAFLDGSAINSAISAELGTQSAAARAPNVVLIVADDLGVPDITTYGSNPVAVPTPNLDRLARRGVLFQRGYSTAAVCSPSRAGLLTGQYPQRHGFEFLTPEGADAGNQGLTPSQRVFATELQRVGYRTAAIGKWHLGATADRLPTARGFDYFFGFLPGETAYIRAGTPGSTSVAAPYLGDRSFTRKVDWVQVLRDKAGDTAGPESVANDQVYLTDELTSEAVRFIEQSPRGKPWFLYLAHLAPHSPFQALDSDLEPFADISDPVRRTYAGMIRALDRGVGRVLDAIERSPDADNTIVIFTSDNGAATYMGVSECDNLAGGKLSYFEGGARVPFLVSWPARWPKGLVDPRNVSQLDVAPTILAAARVTSTGSSDGVDLTPRMQTERRSEVIHETLFWRTGPEYAVLAGNYKLLSNTRQGAFPWLFDLATDPSERNMLTFSRREVVVDLQKRYREWAAEMKPSAWPSKQVVQIFQCGRISLHEQ